MADTTYAPLTYRKDGGDTFIIASGGNMDIESGGTWQIAGVTVTASAADLNTASGSATGTTNATWTVDSDSTGAKLAFNTNSATGNFTGSIVPPASIGANRTWTMQDASGTIAFTTDTSIDVDLGSSGTAGSLDIFPSTAANGKLRFVAADVGAGNDTITITNEAFGQATTLTIPDPSTAAGEFVVTDTAFSALFTMNGADRALSLSGDVTLSGDLTTTGAFNATFAVPSSSTWTLPSGGGTLALSTGDETGTTSQTFTIDSDALTTKIALATLAAGSDFTATISPANHSQDSVYTLPDGGATDTFALLGKNQTLAGDQIITGTVDFRGNVTACLAF